MIRTLIWFIYFWIYQLLALPKLKRADQLKAAGDLTALERLVTPEVQHWAGKLLSLAGVKVAIKGLENIPKDMPVLFVSNHQGNFDIPILLAHLPGAKGFVAKDSIEKMPLVSRWMKHMNCVFMDRENLRQSAAAINEGIRHIKAGTSMVIFPEGTRSLDGQLGEFKAGALKLGTKPAAPIVPIAIDGSIDIMPKGSYIIRPQTVNVTVFPPIMPSEYSELDTVALTEQVVKTIEQGLKA